MDDGIFFFIVILYTGQYEVRGDWGMLEEALQKAIKKVRGPRSHA